MIALPVVAKEDTNVNGEIFTGAVHAVQTLSVSVASC